jgi:hypothetical protein
MIFGRARAIGWSQRFDRLDDASQEHRDMHVNSGMEGGMQAATDHLEQVAGSLR